MRSFAALPLVLVAAFATTSFAEPDGPRLAASHGGVILESGDVRVEFVHDPRTGTAAVYALADPGTPQAFDDAPVLVLSTPFGPREMRLPRIDGEADAWRATGSPLLKGESLEGVIRLRVSGRPFTVALAPSPRERELFERRTGPHGGFLFDIAPGIGWLEVSKDARAGSVTLRAIPRPGVTPKFTAAPVLAFTTADGRSEVRFPRLEGEPYGWKATNRELFGTDERLDGEVLLRIGGNPYVVSLASPSPATPASPASYERRLGGHGGLLLPIPGDAAGLEFVRDDVLGTVTLYALPARGAPPPTFDEPPVFVLSTSGGPREIPLVKVEGQGAVWTATDPADLKGRARIDGQLRLRLRGQARVVSVAAEEAASATAGAPPDRFLVLADGTRIEWAHDATAGEVRFYVRERPSGAVAMGTEPILVLTTPAGPKPLRLARIEGQDAWRVADPALSNARLRGTLRVVIGNKTSDVGFVDPEPR